MDISSYYYKKILEVFENGIKNNTLSGSYIFSGHTGMGKLQLVNKIILMLQGKNFVPHDTYYIQSDEDRNEISIEQIRVLTRDLYTTPSGSAYKIVCIRDAETLSVSSCNALLKILEEPPKNTIFFLIDNKTRPILKTILSRSIIYTFPTISHESLVAFLKTQSDNTDCMNIVSLSLGKPEVALTLLLDPTKKNERVKELQHAADIILSESFTINAYLSLQNTTGTTWAEKQHHIKNILESMKLIIREAIRTKTGILTILSIIDREKNAQSISMNVLLQKMRLLENAVTSLRKNVPGSLLLDSLILNSDIYETY